MEGVGGFVQAFELVRTGSFGWGAAYGGGLADLGGL